MLRDGAMPFSWRFIGFRREAGHDVDWEWLRQDSKEPLRVVASCLAKAASERPKRAVSSSSTARVSQKYKTFFESLLNAFRYVIIGCQTARSEV